ncbi:hypothetical protein P9112_011949 [Eukaryota sp. TZLM1-RC]
MSERQASTFVLHAQRLLGRWTRTANGSEVFEINDNSLNHLVDISTVFRTAEHNTTTFLETLLQHSFIQKVLFPLLNAAFDNDDEELLSKTIIFIRDVFSAAFCRISTDSILASLQELKFDFSSSLYLLPLLSPISHVLDADSEYLNSNIHNIEAILQILHFLVSIPDPNPNECIGSKLSRSATHSKLFQGLLSIKFLTAITGLFYLNSKNISSLCLSVFSKILCPFSVSALLMGHNYDVSTSTFISDLQKTSLESDRDIIYGSRRPHPRNRQSCKSSREPFFLLKEASLGVSLTSQEKQVFIDLIIDLALKFDVIIVNIEALPNLDPYSSETNDSEFNPKFQFFCLSKFCFEVLKLQIIDQLSLDSDSFQGISIYNNVVRIFKHFFSSKNKSSKLFRTIICGILEDARVAKNWEHISIIIAFMTSFIELTFELIITVLKQFPSISDNLEAMSVLSFTNDSSVALSHEIQGVSKQLWTLLYFSYQVFIILVSDLLFLNSSTNRGSHSFMGLVYKFFGDFSPIKHPLRLVFDLLRIIRIHLVVLEFGFNDPYDTQNNIKFEPQFYSEIINRSNLNHFFSDLISRTKGFNIDYLLKLANYDLFRNFSFLFYDICNLPKDVSLILLQIMQFFLNFNYYPIFYNFNLLLQVTRFLVSQNGSDPLIGKLIHVCQSLSTRFTVHVKENPSIGVLSLFPITPELATRIHNGLKPDFVSDFEPQSINTPSNLDEVPLVNEDALKEQESSDNQDDFDLIDDLVEKSKEIGQKEEKGLKEENEKENKKPKRKVRQNSDTTAPTTNKLKSSSPQLSPLLSQQLSDEEVFLPIVVSEDEEPIVNLVATEAKEEKITKPAIKISNNPGKRRISSGFGRKKRVVEDSDDE